ncbi:uncharacterized protein LOC110104945 [Dendrobium catenatum]|uniref:Uncharacterized protein n=1 Tax=Dendrobium catenatum TaxID=906689 RepID=A0A2I0XFK7_9ASPA|nr:uncharacterized protein LOC110104945 [Dendrobium catenatum]PKU86680.1 hypothetical protein MA16_Dca014322 [Dendrobium catenatum]
MNSAHFLSSSSLSLLLFFTLATSLHATSNFSSIESLIQSLAFLHLPHHHSNHPYHLHLPSNLSSITAIALRLRGADLWLRRTNLGYFHLPPGIVTSPHVRRTVLVFYDLGNLSSSFFSVPGHILVAPVISCLAYDASNVSMLGSIREVSLRPMRDPITIVFPSVDELSGPAARCMRFRSRGLAQVGGAAGKGMRCVVSGTGRFSVAVAVEEGKGKGKGKGKGRMWWVWMWMGIVCWSVGMVGLGVGRVRKRRMEEMERRGEEGEVLDSVWVGGSKLPAAPATRTTPAIESDSVTSASAL